MKSGSRYLIHNIYAVESTLNHSNGVNQGVQIALAKISCQNGLESLYHLTFDE